jgi:heterodisulfide reductase subunit B
VTLCAGCHNVLKRTSLQAEHDSAKQTKIIDFNEEVFQGGVNVLHFLEILRDRVGPDAVKEAVKKPLEGLPVGAYYGCLLLRPSDEMRLDDPHRPSIIETLLESVGCVPVDFPSRTECCGSYLGVGSREAMTPLSRSIVQAARSRGARVLAVSCPLCKYNLEVSQRQMGSLPSESDYVPTVYFTQLLGLAFGHEPDQLGLNSIQLQAIRGVTQPTVESVS